MREYDKALREVLPRLLRISDPAERIVATQSAYDEFRRDFPGIVGAMKFFAQIESDAIEELISLPTPTIEEVEGIREILKAEQRE